MENINEAKNLREIIRLLERKLGILDEAQLPCCGITFAQCHAIVEIGRAKNISLNDLAETLGLDKSTMSRTINNLVNRKMAVREINPKDRRYITIQLSENGFKAFQEIEAKMEIYFNKIYYAIPEVKREQTIESLQILLQALVKNNCC